MKREGSDDAGVIENGGRSFVKWPMPHQKTLEAKNAQSGLFARITSAHRRILAESGTDAPDR